MGAGALRPPDDAAADDDDPWVTTSSANRSTMAWSGAAIGMACGVWNGQLGLWIEREDGALIEVTHTFLAAASAASCSRRRASLASRRNASCFTCSSP